MRRPLRSSKGAGLCDALFLSPHAQDVPLACTARLAREQRRGSRVLVVSLFGDESPEWRSVLEGWQVKLLELGLSSSGDDLRSLLHVLWLRTRARHVYVPLGVGTDTEHWLVHGVALDVFGGDSRNVFLYEERPAAFLRGALRIRLGQLGARLPPAGGLNDSVGLLRFLADLYRMPPPGCGPADPHGRLIRTRAAVRAWRLGRAWRPQRSLGLRLQPIMQAARPVDVQRAAEAGRVLGRSPKWSPQRFQNLGQRYARRLGAAEHMERYWLLLPDPEGQYPQRRIDSSVT